jgi:hypothetical protein
MNPSEEVKRELKALVDDQEELLNPAKDQKDIIAFGTKYQAWYSRAYKLVEALAPERLNEFTAYYLIEVVAVAALSACMPGQPLALRILGQP